MKREPPYAVFRGLVVGVLALVLPLYALAKHEPRTYPGFGKVVGTGLNEHTKSRTAWTDHEGNSHGGGTYSAYSHTYRIETDSTIFELDCGKTALFHSTGKACGGEKGLEIGDEIHFRAEKESFYFPLPDGSEQKLRILKEDLKPNDKPALPHSDSK